MPEFKRIRQRTTNSERIRTGVAQVEPNELVITTDSNELYFKNQQGEFIKVSESNTIFSSIDSLVNSANKLKLDDVVDLQGYYEAGDGAHHKRKIEATDDGSGVQLTNGLWANVVHNGEVNVSWFGANGDGVTDDTVAIQKAIDTNNNIVFSKKMYLIKDGLVFKMNKKVEGSGCVLIFTESNVTGIRYGDNNHIKNFVIIFKDNFDTTAIHYCKNDEVARTYPSEAHLENIVILPDVDNYLVTCVKYSPRSNYNSRITNLIIGRIHDGKLYKRKFLKGLEVEVPPDSWGTFIKFDNITIEGFCEDAYFSVLNESSLTSNVGHMKINNLLIQTYSKSLNYPDFLGFNNVVRIKNVNNLNMNNSHVYDYVEGTARDIPFLYEDIINCDFSSSPTLDPFKNDSKLFRVIKGFEEFIERSNKSNSFVNATTTVESDSKAFFVASSGYNSIEEITIRTILDYDCSTASGFLTIKSNVSHVGVRGILCECLLDQSGFNANVVKVALFKEGLVLWIRRSSFTYSIRSGASPRLVEANGMTLTRGDTNEVVVIQDEELTVADSFPKTSKVFLNSRYEITKNNFGTGYSTLDTPYYTTKMQQEGIYEDFITYMDEQHEYEQLQREVEEKRQEAYQLALAENPELTYEEWLSGQPQLMPFAEPQPSQALLDFKKKYLV